MVGVPIRPPGREFHGFPACGRDEEPKCSLPVAKGCNMAPLITRLASNRSKELHVPVLVNDSYLDCLPVPL